MIILSTGSLSDVDFLSSVINQKFYLAFAEQVSSSPCNCILDAINSHNYNHNNTIAYLTIPKVKIIKNESLESQTEGHLNWKAVRSTQLMGIITENFFLGNFSSGTASSVALNTLNIKKNESLGVQITGGSTPTKFSAEVIKAAVNKNGTLDEIKTTGKKIVEFPFRFDNMTNKSSSDIKSITVDVSEQGDYLLLISLTYNSNNKNQETKPLVAIYETVLTIK
jgi:hypothetical protein